jgi:sec-independent protein translocase protein TatA
MSGTLVPLFGPIPGGPEMLVILLIAILLFGANKIPKLARSTGEAMGEFKKGRQEVEQELEELQEGETAGDEGPLGDDETAAESAETKTEPTTETATETETTNN